MGRARTRNRPADVTPVSSPETETPTRDAGAGKPPDKRLVKASFNLPAEELDALKQLAARRNTSATQVLRQALATESYLQRIVDQGGVVVARFGRRAQELIFSQMQLS